MNKQIGDLKDINKDQLKQLETSKNIILNDKSIKAKCQKIIQDKTAVLEREKKKVNSLSLQLENYVFLSNQMSEQHSTSHKKSGKQYSQENSDIVKKKHLDGDSSYENTAATTDMSSSKGESYSRNSPARNLGKRFSHIDHTQTSPSKFIKQQLIWDETSPIRKNLLDVFDTSDDQEDTISNNGDYSVSFENSIKKPNLEYVFKQKKLRDTLLSFLSPGDMIALRSTNKFFHFALSIDSRVFRCI